MEWLFDFKNYYSDIQCLTTCVVTVVFLYRKIIVKTVQMVKIE